MVNKVKAKELRELGWTYIEISKELGCSVAWCKLNLKGVTKHVMEDATVKDLVSRAKSKEAITSGDITYATNKIFPHSYSKEDQEQSERNVKRIRSKVKAEDGTLIRPYWIIPERPRDIYYSMLRILQAKDERDQEDIDALRAEFGLDASYTKSLQYALYSMSSIGNSILGHSVVNEIDRLEDIVSELERRNPVQNKRVKKHFTTSVPDDFVDSSDGVRIKNPIDLSDIEDYIY